MIVGIILASGYSKRMNRDKLLLEFNNKKAVEKVIIAANNSMLDKVILVYRKEQVKIIADQYRVETIKNNKAYLGQSESVKLGVSKESNADAYLFLAGDQPLISSEFINKIIKEFRDTAKGIIIPKYKGEIKMPILFSSKYRDELLESIGEYGGYEIIENNPEDISYIDVENPRAVADFNHYKDYLRFIDKEERK